MPFLALLTWLFFCFGGVSPPVVHPVVLRSCTFSLVTKSLSSELRHGAAGGAKWQRWALAADPRRRRGPLPVDRPRRGG